MPDLHGNKSANESERHQKSEELKSRRLKIDMMHLLHETREPLIDPLAHRAGAGISAGHDPNHRITNDDFEHVTHFDDR